jgi:hypothetical protein
MAVHLSWRSLEQSVEDQGLAGRSWWRVCWTSLASVALVVVVGFQGAPQASAQAWGAPKEQTVASLRANLISILGVSQQLELLGAQGITLDEAAVQLLEADFDENVLPGLMFAENDCFFAEVPVGRAVEWSRNVQLLGIGEGEDELWVEAAVVQESLLKILKHCQQQMYDACVQDDSDPNAALLGGVTRQLSLMDDDPKWDQQYRRCSIGWHGTLSATESLHGSLTKITRIGNVSASTKIVLSGNRTLTVDLPNKVDGASGSVDGRATQTRTDVTVTGQCTTTIDQTVLKTSSNSGPASLRKHSLDAGALIIQWSGPLEKGSFRRTVSNTFNNSKCGVNSSLPDSTAPIPGFAVPGQIADTLSDPLAETISGSRTLYWQLNASGEPTPARSTGSGGLVRIPAIPGAQITADASPLRPWLALVDPLEPDMDGDAPIIQMDITWSLTFGDQ